jgi:hypothetical protein
MSQSDIAMVAVRLEPTGLSREIASRHVVTLDPLSLFARAISSVAHTGEGFHTIGSVG